MAKQFRYLENSGLKINNTVVLNPTNKINRGNCTTERNYYIARGISARIISRETSNGEKPEILWIFYPDKKPSFAFPNEDNVFLVK